MIIFNITPLKSFAIPSYICKIGHTLWNKRIYPLGNKFRMEAGNSTNNTAKMESASVQCSLGRDKLISGAAFRRALKHKCPGNVDSAGQEAKKAKIETKVLKEKRPGFSDDRYNETSYYIENGLRKVYPYHFTFTTFTKGRWVGQKILDVFAKEFRSHPAGEYEQAIRSGSLTVNCKKVDVDYCLKHNELLSNTVHRHEVPVSAEPITIVHADKELVVVNKPASIPVHPCGRYRHNTVVFILAKEHGLRGLRTIHRLDRLTSGILLFGRNPQRTKLMEQQIRNRQVHKQYVCRVEGEFPSAQVDCREPIHVVSYKIGVSKVSPSGKQCHTTFQRLSYNGKTSVVLAKPHTGRMHQIRVHLQYLGYPILNDPLYNSTVFGPNKGRGGDFGGKGDEELIKDLISIHNAENWLGVLDGDVDIQERPSRPSPPRSQHSEQEEGAAVVKTTFMGMVDEASRELVKEEELSASSAQDGRKEELASVREGSEGHATTTTVGTQTPGKEDGEDGGGSAVDAEWTPQPVKPMQPYNPDLLTVDENCHECKVNYRDPKPKDLAMYLHAWKYEGPDWSFETELPKWTQVDWVEEV
ncbi:RNA pseudouridylate synthase domain-containing protein 2-like isoform X2 [Ischnura elegans]|uniref:RNA pseudouridylate synthase domain-containing protein 2-like isoform X2 n=2 Tax=Ischnura elegans TaxID=197161 RepID=UPI001ED88B1D|nr:RNA pseudouridylate synthase domain-containing protein 2-like isoform X2 [Ischnura elegans]XP_046386976.1 RNA pseudouridylate synthase domain-containing protein 2-like isoform X2 [Ischnura elegans]